MFFFLSLIIISFETTMKKNLLISFDWRFDLSMFVLLWSRVFLRMMLMNLMFVQLFGDPQQRLPLWFLESLNKGFSWQPLITNTCHENKQKTYDAMRCLLFCVSKYEVVTNLLLFLTTTALTTHLKNIYVSYLLTWIYLAFSFNLDRHYLFDFC